MKLAPILAIVIFSVGCSSTPNTQLKTGTWRGTLTLQGKELPFNFEILKKDTGKFVINLINAGEKLALDEITLENDSVTMALHIFDASLKARIEGDSLKGYFIKNYETNYRLPFKAAYNQNFRFIQPAQKNNVDFTGKYAVTFTHTTDTTLAVGIFKQDSNRVTGTFLTPTGDYRYLEGSVINDSLHLSTFDGNHAYLFTANKKNDGSLNGQYWSGKTGYEQWTAIKNDAASLPSAESLTFLKEGFDKIDFKFPGLGGTLVSPSDEKYKGKVLILQIFGSWCPNCMDETKFLAPWYDANKQRGVAILGLAYEAKSDFGYASSRVKKMAQKFNVHYDFVIAGTKDKDAASKTLPMLNHVVAFPTTIFIGKDGNVKKIHTGFSGPGTGIYYDQFIQQFNETINDLLMADQ